MTEQFKNLSSTLWAGLTSGFTKFMNLVPALLGAVILLVAGWFFSKFIGGVVERLLMAIKFESFVESAHVSDYLPQTESGKKMKVSSLIGTMAKWFIFLIFVQSAAIILGIAALTGIMNSIILFIPNIIVAGAMLLVGVWAARFVSGLIEASTAGMNLGKPNILAPLARYGIIGFSVIAAISQLGIAIQLINILFTGLVAFLALAFGLAFGLGGKDVASDITRSWLNRSRNSSGSASEVTPDKPEVETSIHH